MKSLVKHLKRVLPVALLAVILGSSTVLAQPIEEEVKGVKGEYAERIRAIVKEAMTKELGLTEEQQTQLAEMRKASQGSGKQIMQAVQAAQVRLKEELGKYDSDPATVQQLATEIKTLQAQAIDHRIASVTRTKEILTAEQFAKIQEKAKAKREAFKKRRGGKHGTRGGFGAWEGSGRGKGGNYEHDTP